MEQLATLVNELAPLALHVPQHRTYMSSLIEHILAFYQSACLKKITDVDAIISAAEFAITFCKKLAVKDKQIEYVFFREDVEISSCKKFIKEILDYSLEYEIQLHASSWASNIPTLKDLCQNPMNVYPLIGNENCVGRDAQLGSTVTQVLVDTSRLQVVSVFGTLGIGKTNYSRRMAQQVALDMAANRVYHLSVKGNTEFPLNTFELYQQLIKTWYVGELPVKKDDLRRLYHQSFEGKKCVLLIEDSTTAITLSLLPKCFDPSSKTIVIVTSRTAGLEKYTINLVESITNLDIVEKKAKAETLVTWDETDSNVSSDGENIVEEGEETIDFAYPKRFHLVLNEMLPLKLAEAIECMKTYNHELTDDVRSLTVLCQSIPLFMRVAAKIIGKQDITEFTTKVEKSLDVAQKKFKKFKSICEVYLVEHGLNYIPETKKFIQQLTQFPGSFHILNAIAILGMKPSDFLKHLAISLEFGFIEYAINGGRYSLMDVVRETLKANVDREQFYSHYFTHVSHYNMEHEYSGIKFMCGSSRYDQELENMKSLLDFMDREDENAVDMMNQTRFILASRIEPQKRGGIYNRYKNCEFRHAIVGDYCDGFAMIFLELRDYNNCRTWAQKALDAKEKEFLDGNESQLTQLSTLLIFASSFEKEKLPDKAKQYWEKIIFLVEKYAVDWQKINGKIADPFLAIAQIRLGKSFNEGIASLQLIYGNHPEIGVFLAQQAQKVPKDRFDEINDLMSRAIKVDEDVFGDTSSSIIPKLEAWSVALLTQHKYKEVEAHLNRALKLRKENGSISTVEGCACMNNLAVACKYLSKPTEAKDLYSRSLAILTKLLGESHPQVIVAKQNMGVLLTSTGDTENAQKFFVKMDEKDGDPKTMAAMYNNYGDQAKAEGDYAKALENYTKSLEIRKKLENNVDLAKTLISLGKLKLDKGDFEGIDLLNEALEIVVSKFGKNNPSYNSIMNDLATAHFKQKKFDEAEKILLDLLGLYRENKEPISKCYPILQNLAVALDAQKKYVASEPYYKECLQHLKGECDKAPGDKALRTKLKQTVTSLAGNLGTQQKFVEAEPLYKLSAELVLEMAGDNSLDFATACQNYGACLVFNQKQELAEKEYAKALVIFGNLLGEEHDSTQNAKEILDDLRKYLHSKKGGGCCEIQ